MALTQPDGFLALPDSGKGHPVLVLHPWWGLNDTIKAFCTRLAEAGFLVFAPDLYHGKVTDQIDEAEALSSSTGDKSAEIVEAIAFLKEQAGSDDPIAVVGFSMGAYYALDMSTSAPESIKAVVVFYGTGPTDFSQSKASYLGHFAELDDFEPLESVNDLEEALKSAGRPVTFYTYPRTGHWFFESDRTQVYDPHASRLAWDRTIAFLKKSFEE